MALVEAATLHISRCIGFETGNEARKQAKSAVLFGNLRFYHCGLETKGSFECGLRNAECGIALHGSLREPEDRKIGIADVLSIDLVP